MLSAAWLEAISACEVEGSGSNSSDLCAHTCVYVHVKQCVRVCLCTCLSGMHTHTSSFVFCFTDLSVPGTLCVSSRDTLYPFQGRFASVPRTLCVHSRDTLCQFQGHLVFIPGTLCVHSRDTLCPFQGHFVSVPRLLPCSSHSREHPHTFGVQRNAPTKEP